METNEFKWVLIIVAIFISISLIGISVTEYQKYQCMITGMQKGLVATDIDAICKKK